MGKQSQRDGIIDSSAFMTQEETAHLLRISLRTLQRMRAKGELVGVTLPNGRVMYHPSEVRAWAQAHWAAS